MSFGRKFIPVTRFNKISTQGEMLQKAGGHRLIKSPTIFHQCVAGPYHIFVNFILNIFTLLKFTKSVDN